MHIPWGLDPSRVSLSPSRKRDADGEMAKHHLREIVRCQLSVGHELVGEWLALYLPLRTCKILSAAVAGMRATERTLSAKLLIKSGGILGI